MGSSFGKDSHSESDYKWPPIPTPPKVPPSQDHLEMTAKEYPLNPTFQLIIHTTDKHASIQRSRSKTNTNIDLNQMATEFEDSLKQYLHASWHDYRYPSIKSTQYLKNMIVLEFSSVITLGLVVQFIFVNRSLYLVLEIKPIDWKGKTIAFGHKSSKAYSKYMDDVILKQHHQGYQSKRGYLTDHHIEDSHINKVHFHCHFSPDTLTLAANLYSLLNTHLTEFNCKIHSKSFLYHQNGPHVCWNWQIFVVHAESIGRCLCFLMANIPNTKNIYFPFHSRTFDFVPHNRFLDHCVRMGFIHNPDPIPLYVDFFKDKLQEIIVPFPQDKVETITLENTTLIVEHWYRNTNSVEIVSYVYQYALPDIKPFDIIQFWFGILRDNKHYCIDTLIPLWMTSKKQFDDQIRNRFGLIMEEILVNNNKYYVDKWGKDYHGFGLLALVVIGDQMTRNIYRGKKKSFMFDKQMQSLCEDGMKNEYLKYLFDKHPIYSWVYNLVFEHAENMDIAELSMQNLRWMRGKLHKTDPMYQFLDRDIIIGGGYKHYKMIEKFGRYLQRDKILGRDTNEQELQYLMKSGFNKMVSYNKK
eukprot:415704_1